MGLKVGGGAEPLVANVALVWFFACVHEVVLLEVGELREALGADVALEGPLPRVGAEVHLEVGELSERFEADVALVVHLAVLLLQRVRQRSVTAGVVAIGTKR